MGLGRIAGLLEDDALREKPCTHAGAICADGEFILAAGADTDGERRRLFSERWGKKGPLPVYAGAEEMLKAHAPDVLVVATHPDSHERYCALAAAYRVPLVICEKPLAGSLRAARRIAALEKKGGPVIIVNHERRYALDYKKAKRLIDGGRFGLLLGVSARLYMGTRRLLDVLWHDGTHLADAAMYLSGMTLKHRKTWGAPLSAARGSAWLLGVLVREGAPVTPGERQRPVPFVMELGAERDHLAFEMTFSLERGRLRIGNGIFELWESGPSPYAEQFRSLKKTEDGFAGKTGYFANMIRDAAACVRDPARKPLSGAMDGLRAVEYLASAGRWGRAP
ncbi:MAG: Gfo/Idh/MocA family oxidoreductase [Treponema sp.]|nr:Gfo/Idh/MocA family oxidoreductase [Treponema sp.]